MGPAPSLLLKVLNLHFSCWQLRKKKKKATCENFILQNCSSYSARRCPRVLPPPHLPAHRAPTGRSCRACPRGLCPTPPAKAQGFCLFYFIDPPTRFTANTARSLFSERFASYVLGQLCSLATTFINQLCFGNISLHYQAKNLLTPVMCFLI